MASLQLRHTRECALSTTGRPAAEKSPPSRWTRFMENDEPLTWERDGVEYSAGCSCLPTIYSVAWLDKKPVRKKLGRNRKLAEQTLPHVQVAEDKEDAALLGAGKNITFAAWSDIWLRRLTVQPGTKDCYEQTMRRAVEVFGHKTVRRLSADDVRALLDNLTFSRVHKEQRPLTSTTQAKHLRAVSTCLEAAIPDYATVNPVKLLKKNERPRPRRAEAAYFEDDELARLFAELADAGVYRIACLLSLKTGMRLGEISGLRWSDVQESDRIIYVRRQFTGGRETPRTKSGKARPVPASEEVFAMLAQWWAELGRPTDGLVLPSDTTTTHITPRVTARRALYPAMARAGIPRANSDGEARTFHSFRHTFARVWLEQGHPLAVLSEHLGHSSTLITSAVYAHISASATRERAEALAGAFPV